MVGMRTYRRAAHTVYELHYHFVLGALADSYGSLC
jgi:hypothetical protein